MIISAMWEKRGSKKYFTSAVPKTNSNARRSIHRMRQAKLSATHRFREKVLIWYGSLLLFSNTTKARMLKRRAGKDTINWNRSLLPISDAPISKNTFFYF
jgi:hypothetical protein